MGVAVTSPPAALGFIHLVNPELQPHLKRLEPQESPNLFSSKDMIIHVSPQLKMHH